ncbi:MAG: Coenzyme F420 hydrogenase/dehydrogenase, beta subunit C-terminal domain, partial [Pseudobutyrivibrio sp.]|uniref:4Fe-4S dicluster domain-containing protein n=1 Tax=Pseudobutyrivibrio sp. TaxID=2014367 RepID=UPI0025E32C53
MITRWISENECTGCGVCISACEQSAIHIRQDNKGFYVPIVDDNCIECERCKKVCESRFNNQKKENKDYPKVFASWSIDENIRFISTSGGVVSELSKAILMKNGYVVGAVYGDNCFVYHDIINDIGDISRIQQSKYVQSFCDSIYEKTKKLLEKGFYVLFCGTPCQIAALKAYLSGEEYPFLFTLDFICMGVNSPLAYKLWLSGLEGQFNKRVVNVWFKYKEKGWRSSPFVTKIRFDDGEELVLEKEKNDYMRGFVDLKLFLRNSC